MKRFAAIILTFVLLMAVPAAALADGEGVASMAKYDTTRAFLEKLDEIGIKYTYVGIDSNGNEKITINDNNKEAGVKYTITYYFNKDNGNLGIRVWELITFDGMYSMDVIKACNDCHLDWKYVTFVTNEDNTVSAQMDVILIGDSVGDIALEATMHLVSVIGSSYTDHLARWDTSND